VIQLRTVSRLTVTVCALGLAVLVAACATPKHSGFLSSYEGLKRVPDPLGVKRLVWINPKLAPAHYHKLLMEKMRYHPAPEGTDQVTDVVLQQIRDYADSQLRRELATKITLTDTPGPGVMRLRWALTGASVKKGLKPWQYIPVGLVIAGVQEAAGVRKRDVDLNVEAEVTDSVTGEDLARSIRETRGVYVKGKKEKLTLDMVKSQIDEWAKAAADMFAIYVRKST
jgi:hypothetical protein